MEVGSPDPEATPEKPIFAMPSGLLLEGIQR